MCVEVATDNDCKNNKQDLYLGDVLHKTKQAFASEVRLSIFSMFIC
jgi:hypothetical protein